MKTLSRYLKPRPRLVLPALAGALLVAAAGTWLSVLTYQRHATQALVLQQAAVLRVAQVRKPVVAPSKTEAEEQKRWATLRTERDFAWAPLFAALENAGNADIELLEFLPDKLNRRVLLRGEAKDEAALIDFMESLSEQKALQYVHLSHRKIRKRDRLLSVSFEIKAGIAMPGGAVKK